MTATTRQILTGAPRTGPWIIGYAVSLGAAFAATATGAISEPRFAALFWIPILACAAMIIVTSWKRHRMLGTFSKAVRTFWRRIVLSAGFMFASYCALAFGQMIGDWGPSALRAANTAALLGIAGMIWSIRPYAFDEKDEFLRSQSIRQLVIASLVALVAVIGWQIAASATGMPGGSLALVILLWFGGLGVGRLVNELKP